MKAEETMTGKSILDIDSNEKERSIATLVTAFVHCPFSRWMLPDPEQYLEYFPKILLTGGSSAFESGTAHRTEDFLATAIWLAPGTSADEEAMGNLMQEAISPDRRDEVFAVAEQIGLSHPKSDHWYLLSVGVDPTCQGCGYGSALLKSGLEVCDRYQMISCLESANERNIPLYERFGFEVTGEIQAGSSPTIYPMVRMPR